MTANLTDRQRRVRIGSDLQDWSLHSGPFVLSQSSIDESGLILHTGTLTVFNTGPESIDIRANPARWREGVVVQVSVREDGHITGNGHWRELPPLRILNTPSLSDDGSSLSLDLGCWLTWANKEAREGDQSGVNPGDNSNSAVVATRLLEASGIPTGSISLGSWDYTVSWPLQKEGNGSFVSQAGALAFANNCRHLYQDDTGVIRTAQWSTVPGTPIQTVVVGNGEALFEYSPDLIPPAEIVEVIGVGYRLVSTDFYSRVDTVLGDLSSLAEDLNGNYFVRTEVIKSVDRGNFTITDETNTTQPKIAFWKSVRGLQRVVPSTARSIKIQFFDPITKRLERIQNADILPISAVVLDRPNQSFFGTSVVRNEIVEYNYNPQDVLISTVKTVRQIRGAIDDSSTTGLIFPVVTERTVTEWIEEKPDQWVQIVKSQKIGGIRVGSLRIGLKAELPQISPNSRPPATTYWPEDRELQELPYEGKETWTHPGGAVGLERLRQITVTPGFSNAQCSEIAHRYVQLLEGRRLAYSVSLPLKNVNLWVPPLSTFVVNDGANLWTVKADGIAWDYTQTGASLAFTGITVARVAAPSPVGTPLPTFVSGANDEPATPEPPPFEPPSIDPETTVYFDIALECESAEIEIEIEEVIP